MWIIVTNESFRKIVIVMSWNISLSIDGDSFERERMITLCTGSMMPTMRRATIAMHTILFIVVVFSVCQEIIAKQNEILSAAIQTGSSSVYIPTDQRRERGVNYLF